MKNNRIEHQIYSKKNRNRKENGQQHFVHDRYFSLFMKTNRFNGS